MALASAAGEDHLLAAAGPVLAALRDKTHESAQLYRRQGDVRICVANAERPIGLRDSIPVGATMSMLGGSGAQVLLAWEEPDRLHRGLVGARFNATMLSAVRRRGWARFTPCVTWLPSPRSAAIWANYEIGRASCRERV